MKRRDEAFWYCFGIAEPKVINVACLVTVQCFFSVLFLIFFLSYEFQSFSCSFHVYGCFFFSLSFCSSFVQNNELHSFFSCFVHNFQFALHNKNGFIIFIISQPHNNKKKCARITERNNEAEYKKRTDWNK